MPHSRHRRHHITSRFAHRPTRPTAHYPDTAVLATGDRADHQADHQAPFHFRRLAFGRRSSSGTDRHRDGDDPEISGAAVDAG